LEVVRIAKAVLGPVGEVVTRGDCAGSALGLADGPVLLESRSTSDGRLVGASVGTHSVSSAVAIHTAELRDAGLTRAARVVRAVGFDNIILGLGRVGSSRRWRGRSLTQSMLESQVKWFEYRFTSAGLVVGKVGDGVGSAGLPAKADDEVAANAYSLVHGVGAGVLVGGELAQVGIVVLNVVHAARTTTLKLLESSISKMGFGQNDALFGQVMR